MVCEVVTAHEFKKAITSRERESEDISRKTDHFAVVTFHSFLRHELVFKMKLQKDSINAKHSEQNTRIVRDIYIIIRRI